MATRSRLLRRFRCSASLRSFASLRRSRSSEARTTHRVVRKSFLVRRRLLRIDSADERRSPSDRMRLVGRAPRSPVLHGLALRTRRSGILLRLLRARSSPHWFARLLARHVRTAVARTPSARPLRSARRTGRLLAPLVCSRLARCRSSFVVASGLARSRRFSFILRTSLSSRAEFLGVSSFVRQHDATKPAQDTPRTGDLRSRQCVSRHREAASPSDAFALYVRSAQKAATHRSSVNSRLLPLARQSRVGRHNGRPSHSQSCAQLYVSHPKVQRSAPSSAGRDVRP